MMPLRCLVRTGVLAFVTQAAAACDEVCVAASADPPAAARVAAPAATRVRVAGRPRRLLNAVFIRVPSLLPPVDLGWRHTSNRDLIVLLKARNRDRFGSSLRR